jgi:hypothetical protein
MTPTKPPIDRSASRAAWSPALGFGGVAGQRVTGNGPAPI